VAFEGYSPVLTVLRLWVLHVRRSVQAGEAVEACEIRPGQWHSIHPDFIEEQVRLRRAVDCRLDTGSAFGQCRPGLAKDSTAFGHIAPGFAVYDVAFSWGITDTMPWDTVPWDTMPRGIPCRGGYHAAGDTMPPGIPCCGIPCHWRTMPWDTMPWGTMRRFEPPAT
jgi:hypothetical protein